MSANGTRYRNLRGTTYRREWRNSVASTGVTVGTQGTGIGDRSSLPANAENQLTASMKMSVLICTCLRELLRADPTYASLYTSLRSVVRVQYATQDGGIRYMTIPSAAWSSTLEVCVRDFAVGGGVTNRNSTLPGRLRIDWTALSLAVGAVCDVWIQNAGISAASGLEEGEEDYDDFEAFDGVDLEIHCVRAPMSEFGSCDMTGSRKGHVIHHRFPVDPSNPYSSEAVVKLRTVYTSGHDCGFTCVLKSFDLLSEGVRARCEYLTGGEGSGKRLRIRTARRLREAIGLAPGLPLHAGPDGMGAVAEVCGMRITVLDLSSMEVTYSHDFCPPSNPACHVVVALDGSGLYVAGNGGVGHYFMLVSGEFEVGSDPRSHSRKMVPVTCKKCGTYLRVEHVCDSRLVTVIANSLPDAEMRAGAERLLAEFADERKELMPASASVLSGVRDKPSSEQMAGYCARLESVCEGLEYGYSSLVHGPGGSGKSRMLAEVLARLTARGVSSAQMPVLGPTGVASAAVRGVTLHSWLRLHPHTFDLSSKPMSRLVDDCCSKEGMREKCVVVKYLVLEEVGMLNTRMLSFLDRVLRKLREGSSQLPFGGVILLMFGDVLQLPPASGSPFWLCRAWTDLYDRLRVYHLEETWGFRYRHKQWADTLRGVRVGSMSEVDDLLLKSRTFSTCESALSAIAAEHGEALSRSVRTVAMVHRHRLELSRTMSSRSSGSTSSSSATHVFESIDLWVSPGRPNRSTLSRKACRLLPAGLPARLSVNVGMQIMYIADNVLRSEFNVVNGSLGTVVDFDVAGQTIKVDFTVEDRDRASGTKVVRVGLVPSIFVCNFRGDTVSRKQFPLARADACTVHKLQGCTLRAPTILDMRGTFEDSQAYVGLSRVRDYRLLYLIGYKKSLVKVSRLAVRFSEWVEANDYLEGPNLSQGRLSAMVTHGITSVPASLKSVSRETNGTVFCQDSQRLRCGRQPSDREGMRIQQSLLNRRTFWYDLETLYDGKREIPYYNYITLRCTSTKTGVRFVDDSLELCSLCPVGTKSSKGTSPGAHRRCESRHCAPGRIMAETLKWIMGYVYRSKRELANAGQSSIAANHNNREPYYLCAYNGSGFDFHFLMREMLRTLWECCEGDGDDSDRWVFKPVMKGGYVVTMTLYDLYTHSRALVLHDLCQLTKCSLSKACSEFLEGGGGGGLDKDCFPHTWATTQRESFLSCVTKSGDLSGTVDLGADLSAAYPQGHHLDTARELVRQGLLDPRKFPAHTVLHKYGRKDVDLLVQLYEAVDAQTLDFVRCGVLNFPTMASYSWYGCALNFASHLETSPAVSESSARSRRVVEYEIYKFSLELDRLTGECVMGGKTVPRCLKWQSSDLGKPYAEIEDYYVYADLVSMYPWAMINCRYPHGKWTRYSLSTKLSARLALTWRLFSTPTSERYCHPLDLSDPLAVKSNPLFPLELFLATTRVSGHDLEPSVPVHKVEGDTRKGLSWSSGKASLRTRWLTSVDLWSLLAGGGHVLAIHEIIRWGSSSHVYAPWVSECFKRKREAQESGQRAKRKMAKDSANTSYGATLKRDFNTVTIGVSSLKQLDDFHTDFEWAETVNWRTVMDRTSRGLPPPPMLLQGLRKTYDDYECTSRPRYHGAFTLSWTRAILAAMLACVNPAARSGTAASVTKQPLYGDTDSFLFHSSRLPSMLKWFGSGAGNLSDDLGDSKHGCDEKSGVFTKVVQFRAHCPKWYGLRAVYPDDTPKEVVKMASIHVKGAVFTMPNGERKHSLGFDDFNLICEDYSGPNTTERVLVSMEDRLLRCNVRVPRSREEYGNTSYELFRGSIHRTMFKTDSTCRVPLPPDSRGNIWTVPHGWRPKKKKKKKKKKGSKRKASSPLR